MRIRSIRPEFWSSEDVAAMDWHTRLVFIGLWSYVDDNGVGRDVHRLILAALFPLDSDMSESSRRLAAGISDLAAGGQIVRYAVDGKPFLHITAWANNQRTDNAGKQRFPLPTCDDAILAAKPSGTVSTLAATRGDSRLGEGEKGRRGEGISCASTDVEREFGEWYLAYPRKRGKGQALKAYRLARKKAPADRLLEAVQQQASSLVAKGPEFAPYPATWLNGERWDDQPDATVHQLREDPDAWMRRRP